MVTLVRTLGLGKPCGWPVWLVFIVSLSSLLVGCGVRGGGTIIAPQTITSVTVTCNPSNIQTNQTSQCSATVIGTGSFSSAVTWSATGGSASSSGVFTPSSVGTASVTATSTQDPMKFGSAPVTVVIPPTITSVTVVCSPTAILTTQTSACTPTVTGTGAYSSAVTWTATGGTITSAGVFTPAGAGNATATATSTQDATKFGSSPITVTTPTILGVTISELPAGTSANVTVTDPNGIQTHLIASQALSAIPGTYTITAAPVVVATSTYNAMLTTQTATVTAGNTTNDAVDYKNVVPATTKVLDSTALSSLSVSPDGLTLTMSASSPVAQSLAVGNVIVVPPTSASGVAPFGMLRTVVSISSGNSQVIATTQHGTLSQAFQRLGFSLKNHLTSASIQAIHTAPGVVFRSGASLRKSLNTEVSSDASTISDPCGGYSLGIFDVPESIQITPTPGLTVNGTVEVCSGMNFGMDIVGTGFLGLQPTVNSLTATASMGEYSDLTLQGDLLSGSFSPKPITLATLDFPPVAVPGLPIWVTPVVSVFVGASGNVSSGLSTEVTSAGTFTGGVTYASGNWSPVPLTPSFQFAYQPPILSASLSAKAYAGIEFDLYVYDVVGPSFKPDAYLDLEANIASNPWWSLSSGIEGPMSLDVTILGENLASYDLGTLFNYSVPIVSASGPFLTGLAIPVVQSINPQKVTAGAPSFSLIVLGSNFVPGAAINFGTSSFPAMWQSTSQLSATIPAVLVASAGTIQVSVTNPGVSGLISNSVPFTVSVPNNPIPTITSLAPASLPVGAVSQTLTINGTGFLPSSIVTFGSVAPGTFYINSTQLTVTLTSADLATLGSYPVVVTSPPPGGGPSNSVSFVVAPSTTAVTISPSSVNVPSGSVQTFSAALAGVGTVVWSVEEGSAGGSITSGGIYTAPTLAGTYHVIATNSLNSSESATSTVTVVTGPAIATIHSFNHATEGANPWHTPVWGTDGYMYGVTDAGGNLSCAYVSSLSGCGTIYKSDTSGNVSTLHSFTGTDGAYPAASLATTPGGTFYGTTEYGGANTSQCDVGGTSTAAGCGSVFSYSATTGFTRLFSFGPFNSPLGVGPEASIVQTGGNLYGETEAGGNTSCSGTIGTGSASGCGAIFSVSSANVGSALHTFSGSEGAYPAVGLLLQSNGNFYGTTAGGGVLTCSSYVGPGCGTIFQMNSSGTIKTLHSFTTQDGAAPEAALILGADGNMYGATLFGGSTTCVGGAQWQGCGTVFKIDTAGNFTPLHSFSGPDGAYPTTLMQASDGYFYGTTESGGDTACTGRYGPGCGTLFRMDSSGNVTVLYAFTGKSDGSWPESAPTQGTDGNLYGAAVYGGTYDDGVIFRVSNLAALTQSVVITGDSPEVQPEVTPVLVTRPHVGPLGPPVSTNP